MNKQNKKRIMVILQHTTYLQYNVIVKVYSTPKFFFTTKTNLNVI